MSVNGLISVVIKTAIVLISVYRVDSKTTLDDYNIPSDVLLTLFKEMLKLTIIILILIVILTS